MAHAALGLQELALSAPERFVQTSWEQFVDLRAVAELPVCVPPEAEERSARYHEGVAPAAAH